MLRVGSDAPASLEKWKISDEYIRDEVQMSEMVRSRPRGLDEIKHLASVPESLKQRCAV